MFVNVVRLMWVLVFVMALPLQALSQVKFDHHTAPFISVSGHSQSSPAQPVTQTITNEQTQGILSSLRWNHFQRHLDEHEPSESFSILEPILSQHASLSRVLSSKELYSWLCRDCTAKYRLSGWKESNAMYVALNGHY